MSDSFRARITFGDITNDDLLVSSLGENRYRLEESPLLTESAFYGDIIEAERQADGSLLFTQVLERSGMKNYDYILPRSIFESDEFEKLLERIDEAGGHWTQAFSGVLLVSLPKESVLDIPQEIKKLRS
jgi:Domain of unknown function (DUF4265)